MKTPFTHHYLYCINRDCRDSIFHRVIVLKVPIEKGSRSKQHFCHNCGQIMEPAFSQSLFGLLKEPHYTKNLITNIQN